MGVKDRFFCENLEIWFQGIDRPMPWKKTKNAYKIWLSEVILQQTRVEQGIGYYKKLVQKYPTLRSLAQANDAEFFKDWEGLGYYSRARNLLASARFIMDTYNGVFPTSYDAIITLKGVGSYTAAAIASFAYNLPYAVVDGNVIRVLSRFYGIEDPVDRNTTRIQINEIAQRLLPEGKSAIHNQAIMDFGALQCTPGRPNCTSCILQMKCSAFKKNMVELLPVKKQKNALQKLFYNYVLLKYKNQVYIRKRTQSFWKDLHEYYLVEASDLMNEKAISNYLKAMQIEGKLACVLCDLEQKLSHRHILARFFIYTLNTPINSNEYFTINIRERNTYAYPKIIKLCNEQFFNYIRAL